MRAHASRWTGLADLGLGVLFLLAPPSAWAQRSTPHHQRPRYAGPGYWEINLSAFFEKNRLERRFELPRLDLNYGVGRRIQLKYEMPWLAARQPGQPTRSGAGDSVAGVKRLLVYAGLQLNLPGYYKFDQPGGR